MSLNVGCVVFMMRVEDMGSRFLHEAEGLPCADLKEFQEAQRKTVALVCHFIIPYNKCHAAVFCIGS